MVALKAREKQLKDNQKKHFDRHHGVRDLTQLMPGDLVWIPDRETEAVVEEEVAPLSYNVSTPGGTLHRNRRNLIRVPEDPGDGELETNETEPDQNSGNPPVRRSSRVSRQLERFDPKWS